jgi:hypothetical protein
MSTEPNPSTASNGDDDGIVTRGTFRFELAAEDQLLDSATNVEILRQLWLDRALIDGSGLGPGNPGDFDFGAWHSACHLLGAGGVRQATDDRLLWLEISWEPTRDDYFAGVTAKTAAGVQTVPIASAEGRELLEDSKLLGFVEGTSVGRVSARRVWDPPNLFNLWRRQDFDLPSGRKGNGGKVWEHWCTLRDIRPSSRIGNSVLTAYVSLASALGDRFAATVIRGRREYGHPEQLCAMVAAGFVAAAAALWDVTPLAIPQVAERWLLEASPAKALEAAESMDWTSPPRYYMFSRKLKAWSKAGEVEKDLKKFGSPPSPPAAGPSPSRSA